LAPHAPHFALPPSRVPGHSALPRMFSMSNESLIAVVRMASVVHRELVHAVNMLIKLVLPHF
jgi:hypothetical protein